MSDDVIYAWPECRFIMAGLNVVICQMTLYLHGQSVVFIWVA